MARQSDRQIETLGQVYLDGLSAAISPHADRVNDSGIRAALERALAFQEGIVDRRLVFITESGALVQRLRLEGFDPVWTKTRSEALVALKRVPPDFIVSDIVLPDGTGEDVYRQAQPWLGDTPIVFATAFGEIDQAVRLVKAGADDYLTKPYDADDKPQLSDGARSAMLEHGWPGNIRELRNRLERAVVLCRSNVLEPEDIFPEARLEEAASPTLAAAKKKVEESEIEQALALSGGRVGEAAKRLGISRTTLWKKRSRDTL